MGGATDNGPAASAASGDIRSLAGADDTTELCGAVPKEPHKMRGAGCDRWGTKRLAAAVVVREILSEVCPGRWFIESGTLLGALRNGRFIPHDDDFDIALVVEGEDAVAELHALRATLAERLPPSLEARVVSSYCDKIEVYEPAHGSYILPGDRYGGADYHYVTVDIQAYDRSPDDAVQARYRVDEYPTPAHHLERVLPVGSIELEGEMFPAPHDPKGFLEAVYGSLDEKAVFDSSTGKYVLP